MDCSSTLPSVAGGFIEKVDVEMIRHKCIFVAVLLLAVFIFNSHVLAEEETPLVCQIMVATLELEEEDSQVEDDTYDLTFFGVAAQKPFTNKSVTYGFETGTFFSLKADTRIVQASSGPSGGSLNVTFDNKLLVFDYFVGGYLGVSFAKRCRIYAGAGPLIIYGRRETDPEDDGSGAIQQETDSGLALGLYGRTGFEVSVTDVFMIGLGLRAITTGLEFDTPVGEIKVEGIQYFLNLSVKI